MDIDKAWEEGMTGKIKRCEFEDQWQLDRGMVDFGIDAHLESLEGEEVFIQIKRIKKEG